MKENKVKNKIFTIIVMSSLITLFTACGGGGGGSSTTASPAIEDITLAAGASSVCTNATAFTVTPTDDPDVVFSTDRKSTL